MKFNQCKEYQCAKACDHITLSAWDMQLARKFWHKQTHKFIQSKARFVFVCKTEPRRFQRFATRQYTAPLKIPQLAPTLPPVTSSVHPFVSPGRVCPPIRTRSILSSHPDVSVHRSVLGPPFRLTRTCPSTDPYSVHLVVSPGRDYPPIRTRSMFSSHPERPPCPPVARRRLT